MCLIFSLNRVTYDYKTGTAIKNNKKFDFEKIIYADKFMHSNRDQDKKIEEKIAQLRI
jgi:hypothetical protein